MQKEIRRWLAAVKRGMLLGWTTGEATLAGDLDVRLAGLGCRLTFSRSGCRDGQQLKSGVAVGVLGDQRLDDFENFLLPGAGQQRDGFKDAPGFPCRAAASVAGRGWV